MMCILKILIHTLFWLVFGLFSLLIRVGPKDGIAEALQKVDSTYFIYFVWAAAIFYTSYFFLIRYFEKRKLIKYSLLSIALSIGISISFLLIIYFYVFPFSPVDYSIILPPMLGSFIIAQCGCLVKGFENWFSNVQLKAEIKNENLKNELELLKQQVNPHFLFNTLNNIDSLITKSPGDASMMLITLSEMLRYMIYETQLEKVPLQKELDYLTCYIRLQQVRFSKCDYIQFDFPSAKTAVHVQVVPMLFIPFVENAFKHLRYAGTLPAIDMQIKVEHELLTFTCSNSCSMDEETNSPVQSFGGVGLENVKRRLNLLYPGKHQLNITKKGNIFSVQLILNI